jgi:hypothetical protein
VTALCSTATATAKATTTTYARWPRWTGLAFFRAAKPCLAPTSTTPTTWATCPTQSAIARDALTVVRDQAEENRDKVSGVNLDEEAANLIRFQQAYQASAKVMQVASQLFDAMIALR